MVTMQSTFDEITQKILIILLSILNVRIWLRLVLNVEKVVSFPQVPDFQSQSLDLNQPV